jgi:hypothetical protein
LLFQRTAETGSRRKVQILQRARGIVIVQLHTIACQDQCILSGTVVLYRACCTGGN